MELFGMRGLVFCTLLGPEGPAGTTCGAVTDLWTSALRGTVFGPWCDQILLDRVAGGTARILRTTQWTRAS